MSLRRGPDLPYSLVAGVTPWGMRWVLAGAKIHAATFAPEMPRIFNSFIEMLDERPAYTTIVANVPIGYRDEPGAPARECDLEARKILRRRGSALPSAPTLSALREDADSRTGHLDAVSLMRLPVYREVVAAMAPYRQRTVYAGNPELSFFDLNGNTPLKWSKMREEGREERRKVIVEKIQGIPRILEGCDPSIPLKHLYDAIALMWSARRVFGHAAKRLPSEAQWDSEGLRMEWVY